MSLAQGNGPLCKADEAVVHPCIRPVVPADVVVLAVRIVVAMLRATEFITAQNHWRALRDKFGKDEVLYLLVTQPFYRMICSRTFVAVVVAPVAVVAVTVLLAILLVVLAVVAHQVVERKAVMAGDIVDAVPGLPSGKCEQIA